MARSKSEWQTRAARCGMRLGVTGVGLIEEGVEAVRAGSRGRSPWDARGRRRPGSPARGGGRSPASLLAFLPRERRRPDPGDGERGFAPALRTASAGVLDAHAGAGAGHAIHDLGAEFQRHAHRDRQEVEGGCAKTNISGEAHGIRDVWRNRASIRSRVSSRRSLLFRTMSGAPGEGQRQSRVDHSHSAQ